MSLKTLSPAAREKAFRRAMRELSQAVEAQRQQLAQTISATMREAA